MLCSGIEQQLAREAAAGTRVSDGPLMVLEPLEEIEAHPWQTRMMGELAAVHFPAHFLIQDALVLIATILQMRDHEVGHVRRRGHHG